METQQMVAMKSFINGFRKKELVDFLRQRGVNVNPTLLKNTLLAKSLEILVDGDYNTICAIRERQLGVRIDRITKDVNPSSTPTENNNVASSSNTATANPTQQIQNKPKISIEEDKTGFFYVKEKIIRQTSMAFAYRGFDFTLADSQYIEILESRHNVDDALKFDIQLQLRVFKTISGEDFFPPGIKIFLNQIAIPVDPWKPQPVEITSYLNFLQPQNRLGIATSCGDLCSFTLNIIKRKTDEEFVEELMGRICTKKDTSKMITAKFSKDDDLQVDMLKVSINCPLGKSRMKYPSRSRLCTHLQCFDGLSYIQMNRRKPKWICPVCYKPSLLKDLVIDKYFEEVLNSTDLKADTTEIQLLSDGTWCLDKKCDVIEILDTPKVNGGNKTRTDVIEILDDTPKKKIPGVLLARFPLLNLNRNI